MWRSGQVTKLLLLYKCVDLFIEFLYKLLVVESGGGSAVACMNTGHLALLIYEDGRRKGEEGIECGQGGGDDLFVGDAAEHLIVGDVVALALAGEDFADKGGVCLAFVLNRYDFDPAGVVCTLDLSL